MEKFIYYDVETTGFNTKESGITEIGAIYVEDDKVIDQFNVFINPNTYNKKIIIIEKALSFRGVTKETLLRYDSSKQSFNKFINWLDSKVNKFDKSDKLTLVGYNSDFFDYGFLREWFNDNNHKYFWSYFNYDKIDVFKLVKEFKLKDKYKLENNKLVTIAEHYEIPIKAHVAMDDIIATFKIHQKLLGELNGL